MYTVGHQNKPAVAISPTGDFVVVWQSHDCTRCTAPQIEAFIEGVL